MAVVKANCYGHGVEICLPELIRQGVTVFGIATTGEARQLRDMGVDHRLALLTTPCPSEAPDIADLDLEILVADTTTCEWADRQAQESGVTLRVHLYVDTGMTKNGASPAEAADLAHKIAESEGLHLQGIFSHFATSEETDTTFARRQLDRFKEAVANVAARGYEPTDIHIANSGGILNFPDSHFTMVRPGIALYGYHPKREEQDVAGFRPVLSLMSVVSSVKSCKAGTAISYGASYVTREDTCIGTIPIGYGDGIFRLLTGRLSVLVGNRVFPVVGTICMDEVMVDLGPDTDVRTGDDVVFIGRNESVSIDAWNIAEALGTIPYEITTALASRVPRVPREKHRT